MNIGIVTQPLCDNFGGVLQNYALQQVLKTLGHNPITLDYLPSLSFGRYLLYAGKGLLYSLSSEKRHPIKPYRHYLKRQDEIDSFVKMNINMTRTIPKYTKRLLKKNQIEALIVGSDQVWRYSYNSHYLEDMFLAFAKGYSCPKVAYAASFGTEMWDYPEMRTKIISDLVKQFDHLSVREDSGVILCREKLGVKAQTVLDPTLLLQASDYAKFCKASDPKEYPYLAAYILDRNDEKAAYIQSLARSKNLKVKEMAISQEGLSIEGWLSTIKNSEFVLTDSYHGCLFSILFEKPFQAMINKGRGADRFATLLSKLNLLPHLTDGAEVLPNDAETFDYTSIYQRLNTLRRTSLSFLASALS